VNQLNRNQAGIALGALFGLMHTLWVAAVGAGIGQPIVDALESGHFLSSNHSVTAFDPVTALTGIIGAVITGYIIGLTFIYIYNFTGKKLDS
jgi:Na+-translocating ferredoxin:NAD+ oxidoreductase RnfD subunit